MNGSMLVNIPAVSVSQTGKKGLGESGVASAGDSNFGTMAFAALLLGLTEPNQTVPGPVPDTSKVNAAAKELPVVAVGLPPAMPGISMVLQQVAGQDDADFLGEKGNTTPLLFDSTGVMVNDGTNTLSARRQLPESALFGDELSKVTGEVLETSVQTGIKGTEVINAGRLEGHKQAEAQGKLDVPWPETEFKAVATKLSFHDNLAGNSASNGLNLNPNHPGEFSSSTVQNQVLKETGFQAIANQLIESSKATLTRGKSEVEIQLKPEYLGKVHLRLALEEGILSARFLVENSAVGKLLENNLHQLRQSLQEQGLKFGQVNVEIGSGNFAQDHAQQFNRPKQHYSGLAGQSDSVREEPVMRFYNQHGINYLA
ncbi:flagellar hook-length control protein FliK [Zhaonella formicivorans]|uniref:flagellar hook-length control protein FliK n=1 Tax=Zhaonella formicivorans TaxID=2528593 RepID=UPI0010E9175C|nr:flagellar hook-length control protein FliK [Zhaonella formicivorans]